MKLKTRLKIRDIKDKVEEKIILSLRFLLTPLAYIIDKQEKKSDEKYEKDCKYANNMSEQELMQRLAKVEIDNMIRYKRNEMSIPVYNKFKYCTDHLASSEDGYESSILYKLNNFHNDKVDKYLAYARYNKRFDFWAGYEKDENLRYEKQKTMQAKEIETEKRLLELFAQECEKLGAKVSYEDLSEEYNYSKYFIEGIGYEKSLVVRLK